jgi:putative chitinase
MSPQTLAAATGCTLLNAARFASALTEAMDRWGIVSTLQRAGFLGNIVVESGGLQRLEENLNYSAERLCAVWPARFPTPAAAAHLARNPEALANSVYGGRMGNTMPGDGWKFRGRGLKQLTGKANYIAYSQASGANVVADPDVLLEPHAAADSAAWFWAANGCGALADAENWAALTRRINGGMNGHTQRVAAINRALRALEPV